MTCKSFLLPDLGEGLTESELVSWRVAVGDTVHLNEVIAEVETAKALVELPSPFAGVVRELFAEPGETVRVGAPLVAVEVSDAAGTQPEPDAAPTATAPVETAPRDASATTASRPATPATPDTSDTTAPRDTSATTASRDTSATSAPQDASATTASRDTSATTASRPGERVIVERQPVLVGYGPPVEGGARPSRKPRPGLSASPTLSATSVAAGDRAGRNAAPHRAAPPVRKLARELGVDLATMPGTGAVTRAQVCALAASAVAPAVARTTQAATTAEPAPSPPSTDAPPMPLPVAPPRERETRIPIRGVRKLTAQAMVDSAFRAPHATEFLTVDVTLTTELLARLGSTREFDGRHLSILVAVAKALCVAVARTPAVNSHWDEERQEIVLFGYVNLGIAVATPRGLVVPNIRDAERLDLAGLTDSLSALASTAKAGRAALDDLRGGTISITNIGVFGIDAGTPILNPGEAAILAIGAVRRMPWEHRGEVALRNVMTLSLSFDHRLVDGEQASRFLSDIGRILSDPATLLALV